MSAHLILGDVTSLVPCDSVLKAGWMVRFAAYLLPEGRYLMKRNTNRRLWGAYCSPRFPGSPDFN
jgi:hypothetical protein